MPKRVYIPTNKMSVEPDLNSTLENEGFYDPITGARYAGETEARPRQNWMVEPDLTSTLTGNYDLPEGAYLDPMGRVKFKDTGEELKIIRRPNLLPLVETPQGAEFVMPKLLDIVGNVMGGVAAPVKGAGTVLGSGPVLRATEKAIEKTPAFFSPVENAIAASKQTKADAQQWLGYLKNQQGVKADELEHLGLNNLSGSLTKEELLAKVKEGQPQINEVWKGGDDLKYDKAREEYNKAVDRKSAAKYDTPEYFAAEKEATEAYERLLEARKIDDTKVTKYHGYQLPGGENYREMLLTMPEKNNPAKIRASEINKRLDNIQTEFDDLHLLEQLEKAPANINEQRMSLVKEKQSLQAERQKLIREYADENGNFDKDKYKSSHWDEPNVLAHIRMNDRTVDGKKSLHIEEIQSDWHQQGRKQGYNTKDKIDLVPLMDAQDKTRKALSKAIEDTWLKYSNGKATNYREARDLLPNEAAIIKSEVEKHQLYDKDFLKIEKEAKDANDAYYAADSKNNLGVPDAPFKKSWDELALKKAIRHAAENNYDQISWTPGPEHNRRYPGRPDKEQQGMEKFYDEMLVNKANALGKKFGVKVEKGEIEGLGDILPEGGRVAPDRMHLLSDEQKASLKKIKQPIHVMKLTPEFKAHILEKGFPLFSVTPSFTPVSHDPFKMTPVDYNPDFT